MKTHEVIRLSMGLGMALVLAVSSALDGAEPQQPAGSKSEPVSKLSDEELQKLLKRYAAHGNLYSKDGQKIAQEPAFKEMVEELRRKFPYESLSQRLAYEAERIRKDPKVVSAPKLTDLSAKQLEEQEQQQVWRQRWEKRVESLRMLHTDEVEKFVTREGFGRVRAPEPSMQYFQLPQADPIPLATVSPLPSDEIGEATSLPKTTAAAGTSRMPSVEQVTSLHRTGLMEFFNPSFFGHVKDRDKVAGFQPHQFRHQVSVNDFLEPKKPVVGTERWQLKRLELVSLLKYEQPAVYLSEHLPRMDQLAKAKVRTLDSFEAKALKALQDGENLKAEATTNVIRMVGALRATKQCLECHTGERGMLLGAFSYEMQRDPPLPIAK